MRLNDIMPHTFDMSKNTNQSNSWQAHYVETNLTEPSLSSKFTKNLIVLNY